MPDVIQTPPLDESSGIVSVESIIDDVAGFLGSPDDPDVWDTCARLLDRAATRINMAGIYLFNLAEHVAASPGYTGVDPAGTTLADGDETIALPADWGWAYGSAYVKSADGVKTLSMIDWLDWERFIEARLTTTPSLVEFCALRSEQESMVHVYPRVSTSNCPAIVFPYYRRVPRPSQVATINCAPETYECLLAGGQAFAMRHRYKDKPNIWMPYWQDFTFSIRLAKQAAQRRQRSQHYRARVRGPQWSWPVGR